MGAVILNVSWGEGSDLCSKASNTISTSVILTTPKEEYYCNSHNIPNVNFDLFNKRLFVTWLLNQ